MNKVCKLASMSVIVVLAARTDAVPNYRAVVLEGGSFAQTNARAVANGLVAGGAGPFGGAPLLWTDPSLVAVDMTPPGMTFGQILSTDGTGFGGYASGTGESHAIFWPSAAPGSAVDLHPPSGYTSSEVFSVMGNQQVGLGSVPSGFRALLWTGSAASALDLTPSGYASAIAYATDGVRQVGTGRPTGPSSTTHDHALMWSGTADSVVDLTPAGFQDSTVNGIAGVQQVGSAVKGSVRHAILWFGSADNYVDLNPSQNSNADAYATNGTYQVGQLGGTYAALWAGSADSWFNLHALLPPAYQGESGAFAIDADGNVAGYCRGADGFHAVVWLVPEPSLTFTLLITGLISVGARSRRRA